LPIRHRGDRLGPGLREKAIAVGARVLIVLAEDGVVLRDQEPGHRVALETWQGMGDDTRLLRIAQPASTLAPTAMSRPWANNPQIEAEIAAWYDAMSSEDEKRLHAGATGWRSIMSSSHR